jgi:UrcA family protein
LQVYEEIDMNRKFSRICTNYMAFTTVAGVLGGLLAASVPVFAQDREVITVVAPREMVKTVGQSAIGAPIKEVSLSFMVSYAGLDLTNPSDYAEVEKRINDAGAEACKQLDQLYPLEKADRGCAAKAANTGMAELKAIVGAKAQ